MTEACIYKQAEGLTSLLSSKGTEINNNGQEELQYVRRLNGTGTLCSSVVHASANEKK